MQPHKLRRFREMVSVVEGGRMTISCTYTVPEPVMPDPRFAAME